MELATGANSPNDLLALRRSIYAKGDACREDLSRLLILTHNTEERDVCDLDTFIAEVATDLLVSQVDPKGYVSVDDVDWLIAELGRIDPPPSTRRRLLTAVIDRAVSVPERLAAFTVASVEHDIVSARKVVTADDVAALRSAVFAATDASSLHVTRQSAEALFRIARGTCGAENDPAFDDFFAKAIGNHLLGIPFRWTPSSADEVRKERLLDAESPRLGGFLSHMFGKGDHALSAAAFQTPLEADEMLVRQENEADALALAEAHIINDEEAQWLLAQLGSRGTLMSSEDALLAFLKQEATTMPQELVALCGDNQHAPTER